MKNDRAIASIFALLSACRTPAAKAPVVVPAPSLTLTYYASENSTQGPMLVDDVRDLTIAGDGSVTLDDIEAIVDLSTLHFELFAPGVTIGRCNRTPNSSSTVKCSIDGAPAGTRVRLRTLYNRDDVTFVHKLVIDALADSPTTARVMMRPSYIITLPSLHRNATVVFLDRTLSWTTPVLLYRGEVDLAETTADASATVLLGPEIHTTAHVEWIYRGAEYRRGEDPHGPNWRIVPLTAVKRYLVVDGVGAASASSAHAVRDAINLRDAVTLTWLSSDGSKEVDGLFGEYSADVGTNSRRWEMPPRTANLVNGHREKTFVKTNDGAVDSYRFELTNLDKEPHSIEIEEDLRPARSRNLVPGKSGAAHIDGDILRLHLDVAAGATAQATCKVEYEF